MSLMNLVTAPLTKYMAIAVLVLVAALGGVTYLSYKFYGEKEVAEQESVQLQGVVKQEKEQTEKIVESNKIIDKAISEVREDEKNVDKASEKLKNSIKKETPTQPTGDCEDGTENVSEPSGDFLSDDDVRLLQQAHCLSDGDTSDCNI